jgi:16S rRNA processing protein RimM
MATNRPTKVSASQGYLAVGNIVGVHGIRGEVKIEAARPHKGMMLVRFAGVPDRNAAELLRDTVLLIPEEQAMPLGVGENYAHDLIGLQVETTDGRVLGKLAEILYTRANDVYVVKRPGAEVLIPALNEVVITVDLEAGRMLVQLPEGLEAPAGTPDQD